MFNHKAINEPSVFLTVSTIISYSASAPSAKIPKIKSGVVLFKNKLETKTR